MDRTLDVHTPESIAFSFELAGVGSRFLAVMIDLTIQIAVIALLLWGLFALGAAGGGKGTHAHDSVAVNIGIGIFFFVVFLIFFGYFVLFEALWSGQTPGKKALGIRVVRDGGYPVDFTASLVRNLVRIGEAIVGFYAAAAIAAISSPMNKRLGDMAAGTIVVRDTPAQTPESLLRDLRVEPQYAATAYVSGEERAIVKRFLERRDTIVPERRVVIARELAERIRPRLPADMQRLGDESLLERL